MQDEIWKGIAIPAAALVVLAGAIVVGIRGSVHSVVQSAILDTAEVRALSWTADFSAVVPNIGAIARGVAPTAQQLRLIEAATSSGDIFRFKLFDRTGRLAFVSDEYAANARPEPDISQSALSVVTTGKNDVSIHEGHGAPDRPETYVEAYVQGSEGGVPWGALEVYVDVSDMARSLRNRFERLGMFLVLGTAAAFLIPSLAATLRTQQLRRRDREVIQLSRLDPLTGLLNRGAFSTRLAQLYAARDRHGEDVGLIFIDLDRFKDINDTYGHDVGDSFLRHTADVLTAAVRTGDLVGRMGGDEFIVALPSVSATRLRSVGRRIIADLAQPFDVDGKRIWPGASGGAHQSPPGESQQVALRCADAAAYRAKSIGRGQLVEYSQDLDRAVRRKQFVETSVRRAVETAGFFVEFQPVVRAADLRLIGFEALIRMKDESGVRVQPDEFVPVAEECGLIDAIGDQILCEATSAARDWGGGLFVSVNLSPLQFRTDHLVGRVERCLQKTGLRPSLLELEVTESALLDQNHRVNERIADLMALGVTLALDDFGTGFSSLGNLWQYRFDKIKIDRSFLRGFDFDPDRYREVVSTIMVLGHQLGLSVTAEGVETEAHRDLLVGLGCDMLQGFLFSQPLDRESARALATTDRSRWAA